MATSTRFDEGQIRTLVVLERAGGSISLLAALLILIFYSLFSRLRTVPNTFIAFAAVANLGAAIGCIIAHDGIHQGLTSPLCQLQGFLLQMFVQSDPWWALAIAVNVLMVFSGRASPKTIKKWGWVYCLICYGGPFGLALACLLIKTPGKSLVYGDAGTWCWISDEWASMRIYTCYMVVWGCILTSLVIYTGIGMRLFRTHIRLRHMSEEGIHSREIPDRPLSRDNTIDRRSAISISDWPLTPTADRMLNSALADLLTESANSQTQKDSMVSSPFPKSRTTVTRPDRAHSPHRSPNQSFDTAYSGQTTTSAGLTPFLISSTPGRSPSPSPSMTDRSTDRFAVDDQLKRAYLRTAVLFALSALITWAPTSAHRVHELIHGDAPFAFHAATAATLPLQGLWSGIIFFGTSWHTLQESLTKLHARPSRIVKRKEEKRSVAGSIKSVAKPKLTPKAKAKPQRRTRHGRSVYSMWQDAEPAGDGNGNNSGGGGLGLGIHVPWRKDSTPTRQDSWDFLDIGVDESQLVGLRSSTQTSVTGAMGSERAGTALSGSLSVRGPTSVPPPMKSPRIVVQCPGGMI